MSIIWVDNILEMQLGKYLTKCLLLAKGLSSMTAFLILSPSANTLSRDVTIRAVHFGDKGEAT